MSKVQLKPNINHYAHLIERMLDDAAFLWLLRDLAVDRPNYFKFDIAELDQRIQAQLDGLMTAPEISWELCLQALEFGQPGELFAAANVAFRSLDVKKIQHVIEFASATPPSVSGLISALGWLPEKLVGSWINKFLTSKDLFHKYIAISASSVRREDIGMALINILEREDCRAHDQLYVRALRLIGELKRHELVGYLESPLTSKNADVQFWALWSSILLGNKQLAQNLQRYVLNPNPLQIVAIEIAFRVLPLDVARNWISVLAKTPENVRAVILASTVLGDPHAVDWLIHKMREPVFSRAAGEAFTTLTGIHLEDNKLALEELPELDDILPEKDESDVSLDDDEYLPFPDVEKIAAVWQKYKQHFVSGQRYFMGKQITPEQLNQVYLSGNQRQRRAAAMELGLLETNKYLFNHKSPGSFE